MESNETEVKSGNDTGNGGLTVVNPDLDAAKISVLSSMIVLTLLGNGFVLVSILYRTRQTSHTGEMTRMYYFMLHLSVADILTALLTLLSELIWTFTFPNFYGGDFVCKSVKFLQMIGPYLSSYVLVMTAIDRFQAICHPLTNTVWAGTKSKAMLFAAWSISLLLCVPQAIIFSTPPDAGPLCIASFQPNWGVEAYVTWFSISNFFVPLLILIFCYVKICCAIWRGSKRSSANTTTIVTLPKKISENDNEETLFSNKSGCSKTTASNGPAMYSTATIKIRSALDEGISRAKIRSIQQTVAVILTYISCSTPFICVQLWTVYGQPSQAVLKSVAWLFWLLTLNSVVNPFIYLAFNRELRQPIVKLFNSKSHSSSHSL